jgi:hypothetical protein
MLKPVEGRGGRVKMSRDPEEGEGRAGNHDPSGFRGFPALGGAPSQDGLLVGGSPCRGVPKRLQRG